jgi:hypothetical protein
MEEVTVRCGRKGCLGAEEKLEGSVVVMSSWREVVKGEEVGGRSQSEEEVVVDIAGGRVGSVVAAWWGS